MSEPTFPIGLSDLKLLALAVCDLDAFRPRHNPRIERLVIDAHAAIGRALGDQAHLVYAQDDEPQKVPA